ncbi:MAG: glycosyltransferase family 4 protein [Thermoanaerobaculia bacterium]|nr:glycosyltransferase family 4 protein [Thermoanaerobaculia bacterium]
MRVAVVQAPLAPFHVARFRAAGEMGRSKGHTICVIELGAQQREYEWGGTRSSALFERQTLFANYESALRSPFLGREVGAALRDAEPDVVFAPGWGADDGLVTAAWAWLRHLPLVVITDSHRLSTHGRFAREQVRRAILRRYDAFFTAGTAQRRFLDEFGVAPERIFTGVNVVDNAMFRSVQREGVAKAERRETVVLTCARFIEEKNLPWAVHEFRTAPRNWKWKIVGYGPLEAEIRRAVETCGLDGRVEICARTDYARMPQVYRDADIYLQPSLRETWGLAINEAMAAGLPVMVSRRCGAFDDLVEDETNGIGFSPEKNGELTRALMFMETQRGRWPEMGAASEAKIAPWDLGRFARSFWAAAEKASEVHGDEGWNSIVNPCVARILLQVRRMRR